MAKKVSRGGQTPRTNVGQEELVGVSKDVPARFGDSADQDRKTEDALGDFAADLGQFLGSVQSKASSWLDQRKSIADQLTQIRDTANQYLEQLTGASQSAVAAVTRGRRGRPAARPAASGRAKGSAASAVTKTGRRKGFKMSEEARSRIAEAQKKRWAKYRKAAGAAGDR